MRVNAQTVCDLICGSSSKEEIVAMIENLKTLRAACVNGEDKEITSVITLLGRGYLNWYGIDL